MNTETIDKGLLDQAAALRPPSSPAATVDSGNGGASPAAAAAPGASPAAPGSQTVNFQEEAQMLVDFVIAGVGPMYPSVEKLYPPEKRKEIAAPLGRVFAKYDLTFLKVFMRWEPEISLAMVTVPLIGPTILAVRADNAAAKAAAEAARKKQAGEGAAAST